MPYSLLDPHGIDRIIDSFYTAAGLRRQVRKGRGGEERRGEERGRGGEEGRGGGEGVSGREEENAVPYALLDPHGIDRIIDSFYTAAGQRRQVREGEGKREERRRGEEEKRRRGGEEESKRERRGECDYLDSAVTGIEEV